MNRCCATPQRNGAIPAARLRVPARRRLMRAVALLVVVGLSLLAPSARAGLVREFSCDGKTPWPKEQPADLPCDSPQGACGLRMPSIAS